MVTIEPCDDTEFVDPFADDEAEEKRRSGGLWYHARHNNVERLKELLGDTDFVDAVRQQNGEEIMAVAAENGHLESVALLLACNFSAKTALERGCGGKLTESESISLVDLVLSNVKNTPDLSRSLELSAGMGYLSVVRRLLDAGADPLVCDRYGRHPLHRAASRGSLQHRFYWRKSVAVAELLLELGADPDCGITRGSTPLIIAAAYAYEEMVELLLRKGADPNIPTNDGETALHRVSESHSGRRDPWFGEDWGTPEEGVAVIRLLLQHGAMIDSIDSAGDTAVSLATTRGNILYVQELIAHGAKINTVNKKGCSPLGVVASYQRGGICYSPEGTRYPQRGGGEFPDKQDELADLLLAHGANPLRGAPGWTPIESAVLCGNAPLLRKLLSNLGSGNVSAMSLALLHAAAQRDAADCLHLLLPHGLEIGTSYSDGRMSPLHTAARYGATAVLTMCLEAGGPPDIRDRLGRTPLHHAARYDRADAIAVLFGFGANSTICDKRDMTPLQIAQEKHKKRAFDALTHSIQFDP